MQPPKQGNEVPFELLFELFRRDAEQPRGERVDYREVRRVIDRPRRLPIQQTVTFQTAWQ